MSSQLAILEGRRRALYEEQARLTTERDKLLARQTAVGEAVALADVCLRNCVNVLPVMEQLQSAGLSAIFERDFNFMLVQKPSGVVPIIALDGHAESPDDYGDGVLNVSSSLWRLVTMMLSPGAKFIYWDEPVSNLKLETFKKWWEFWTQVAEKYGIQLIVNTHFTNDFPYEVKLVNDDGLVCIDD